MIPPDQRLADHLIHERALDLKHLWPDPEVLPHVVADGALQALSDKKALSRRVEKLEAKLESERQKGEAEWLRLLTAEREANTLKDALTALSWWAHGMPDAGFTKESPRWAWWYGGATHREKARTALASVSARPKEDTPG